MWVHLTKGTPLARSHYNGLQPLGLHTATGRKKVEQRMTEQIASVLWWDRNDIVCSAIEEVTAKGYGITARRVNGLSLLTAIRKSTDARVNHLDQG